MYTCILLWTEKIKYFNVRNLGAIFDTYLDMNHHVNAVSRTCYTQIRNISKIRQYLTIYATKSLVNSTITSRLDYCNGLLYGANQSVIKRLQVVQNTAARLITKTPKHAHINPVLKQLHWLPVNRRVEYFDCPRLQGHEWTGSGIPRQPFDTKLPTPTAEICRWPHTAGGPTYSDCNLWRKMFHDRRTKTVEYLAKNIAYKSIAYLF